MYNYTVHVMDTLEMTYSEARANLASLWDKIVDDRQTAILHRRGKEDIAMLPASELSGIMETAHLLRSPENAKRLFEAIQSAHAGEGKTMTLEELKRDVGLK